MSMSTIAMTQPATPAQEHPAPYPPLDARKMSALPVILTLVASALCAAWYFVIQANVVTEPARTPNKFILPEGFTGKVRIVYDVQGAPPLPVADGHRVIGIPHSGIVETSTPVEYGRAEDRLYRLKPGGGLEGLNVQWVRSRKAGIVGDQNEFFQWKEKELAARDAYHAKNGWAGMTGTDIKGKPYELLWIRADFDKTPRQ